MKSFTTVTVGVADLNIAQALWLDAFGFEILDRREGGDAELARLWNIAPLDIRRQALIGTPGQSYGRIHFIEFKEPGPAVRAGAEVFDWCPKNLDIYVKDLPEQMEQLKARGYTFRNHNYSDVTTPDGIRFREIHMPSHDDINVVLLQIFGKDMDFPPHAYAGVGPLISIVPDAEKEKRFYRLVLGLDVLSDNILRGSEIEKMVGLPSGAALNVSIWGHAEARFGQIEIIEYEGTVGANLYPRAKPKSRGILHITYQTPDFDTLKSRLNDFGIAYVNHGQITSISAQGETISFRSPAGFRIEVVNTEI